MRAKSFGFCPSCLRLLAVKKDGTTYRHIRSNTSRDAPYAAVQCEGGVAKQSKPSGRGVRQG